MSAEIKLKVIEKTLNERPPAATRSSVRSMAKAMGISFPLLARSRRTALCRDHQRAHQTGRLHAFGELKEAIDEWISHHNDNPKPLARTAKASAIPVKHRRATRPTWHQEAP
jgi:hypothetical protein